MKRVLTVSVMLCACATTNVALSPYEWAKPEANMAIRKEVGRYFSCPQDPMTDVVDVGPLTSAPNVSVFLANTCGRRFFAMCVYPVRGSQVVCKTLVPRLMWKGVIAFAGPDGRPLDESVTDMFKGVTATPEPEDVKPPTKLPVLSTRHR